MPDLITLARAAWAHDKGGLFAALLIPAAMWMAGMIGEVL
jgi:hypothetical protein